MARKNSSTSSVPCTQLNIGAEYTSDEVEFIRAMDEYIRTTRRRFPTFVEVLNVAKSLGYRPPAEGDPPILVIERKVPRDVSAERTGSDRPRRP